MEGGEVDKDSTAGAGGGTLVVVTDAGAGAQTHKYPTAFEVKTCEDTQVKWMQITEGMNALINQCVYARFVREESESQALVQRVFQSSVPTAKEKKKNKKPASPPPTFEELRERPPRKKWMHDFPTAESPIGAFAKLLQEAMGIEDLPFISYSAMYHDRDLPWHADDNDVGQCFFIVKLGPTAHDVSFAMQHAKDAKSHNTLTFKAQGFSIYFLPPDHNLRYAAHKVDCKEHRAVLRLGFGVLSKKDWEKKVAHFVGCHCNGEYRKTGFPDLMIVEEVSEDDEEETEGDDKMLL